MFYFGGASNFFPILNLPIQDDVTVNEFEGQKLAKRCFSNDNFSSILVDNLGVDLKFQKKFFSNVDRLSQKQHTSF